MHDIQKGLSGKAKELINQPPYIGYKRLLSFFYVFSIFSLFFLYSSIFIESLLGNPPFAKQAGGAYNFIFEYSFSAAIFSIVLINYLWAFLPIPFKNKSLLGLAIISNNVAEPQITRKQWIIRNVTFGTLLLILDSLNIHGYVLGLSYFIFHLLFIALNVSLQGFSINSQEGANLFSNLFMEKNELVFALTHLPLFLLYYFIFVNTWKRRGIHDIVAGTKMVDGLERFKTTTLVGIFSIFTILYICAYPFGIYLESTFSRSQKSYDNVISAERKAEYKDPTGWSIQYDPVAIRPYYIETEKRTTFSITTFPSSCIFAFYLSDTYDNPQNLSFEEFKVWMRKTRNWEVFPENDKYITEKTRINGYDALKVTFINKDLKPINNENIYNLKKTFKYYINANGKIYEIMYDITENEYTLTHLTDRECQHTENEVQKMMESFRITQ